MSIRFYVRTGPAPAMAADLPAGCELRIWRPASDGPPRPGPGALENLAWLAIHRLGLFASDDFEEITIWGAGRRLHRLVVTPRWQRFPFMAPGDLQVGALWTAAEARRSGLARAAIAEAHRRHAMAGRSIWCLTDEANAASVALAETCGYRLAGAGRRTRPLGFAALGQFRLESVTVPSSPGGR